MDDSDEIKHYEQKIDDIAEKIPLFMDYRNYNLDGVFIALKTKTALWKKN